MAVTLSGQFVSVFIANAGGTLVEISTYLTSITPQRASEPIDLSAFAGGGGPITATILRGAAVSEFSLAGLFDPVYVKLLRQITAARAGVLFQIKAGANATPTLGDVLFNGTMLPIGPIITYNAGNTPAGCNLDLKPADGGAVTPAFATI
jgi:hypothetical protein